MENLALKKTVSASSYILPYSPDRAVDGIIDRPIDRWLCSKLPGNLEIDLGNVYYISQWIVYHMGAISGWDKQKGAYDMSDYSLMVKQKDTDQWREVDSVSGNLDSKTDRIISDVPARYVQLVVSKGLNVNPTVVSCMNIAVCGMEHSANLSGINGVGGKLNQKFDPSVLEYTYYLDNSIPKYSITPTLLDSTSLFSLKVGDKVVESISERSIDAEKSEKVFITVSSKDGMTKTYTVNVIRASDPLIQALMINSSQYSEFSSSKTNYTYKISTTDLTFSAFVKKKSAKLKYLYENREQEGAVFYIPSPVAGTTLIITSTSLIGNQHIDYYINFV